MPRLRTLIIAFAAAVLAGLSFTHGWAEQRELKTDAAEKLDAVLALDASGSMLITDPLRLRDEGARLFVQFLKPEDRLAIIQFADDAKVVRPLSPFSAAALDEVARQVNAIGTTGQFTDILAAVKLAGDLLIRDPRPDAKPVIILLSDGKMEPDPQKGTAAVFSDRLLNEVLPDYKARGIRVCTLAFSEQADQNLLAQVAAGTGGINWFTPNADKIHQSYAELFLAVKKPQVVLLNAKGFQIDADVQEATFYINRAGDAEIKIQTPGGRQLSKDTFDEKVKWFHGNKFDVITVVAPEVGSWQVLGVAPEEGFATILTNLKLVTDWPLGVEAGSPQLLQARLYEAKKPVDLPEMANVVRYAFQIIPTDRISEPVVRDFLADDGSRGDKIAKDGIFSYLVTLDEPGEYRLTMVAKAPTFERRQQIPFRVKPAIISLRIVAGGEKTAPAPEGEVEESAMSSGVSVGGKGRQPAAAGRSLWRGNEESIFQIELSEEARNLRNLQVKLMAVDDQRNRYLLPVRPAAEGVLRYEASAGALPRDGRYELQAALTGEEKNRTPRKELSQTAVFMRVSSGVAPEETAVLLDVPKKPAKKSWFPLWEVVGVLLVNLSVGFLAFVMLKRAQGELVLSVPEFKIPDNIMAAIAELEKRVNIGEVDLNSPLFAEEPAPEGGAAKAPVPPKVVPAAEEIKEPAAASEAHSPQAAAADDKGGEAPQAEQGAPAAGESKQGE